MKSVTIRGVDEHLAELLKKRAVSEQKSMNQLLLEIVRNSLGVTREKQFTVEYTDLDFLFGSWSESEFKQIQEKISAQRQIDQELWQ